MALKLRLQQLIIRNKKTIGYHRVENNLQLDLNLKYVSHSLEF